MNYKGENVELAQHNMDVTVPFVVLNCGLNSQACPTGRSTAADSRPIMHALVMDFPEDKNVHNIGDQYLFGPAILVNPVHDYGARDRDVYLPAGITWYDFYTGTRVDGGAPVKAAAPLARIPLYVRAGSIIPMGPEIQYTGEKPDAPVTLHVYIGRDGGFSLYEDIGARKGDLVVRKSGAGCRPRACDTPAPRRMAWTPLGPVGLGASDRVRDRRIIERR